MALDPVLDACRTPNWYPQLSAFSLPTSFVALQADEIEALAAGEDASAPVPKRAVRRLRTVMKRFPYNRFLSVDLAAPVDTDRFKNKRGAIRSAESAWNVLAESERVRESAKRGEVTSICVRPFRRMDITREFRLFVKDGKLFAMSQYWLVKHFPKLEKTKKKFWKKAESFVEQNAWAFPLKDVVMDIYFTSSGKILITDLNPLSAPTDPLMFSEWEKFDWTGEAAGIRIVPPPHTLSGDVNVSF